MLFNEEIALTLNELFRMAVEDYGLVLGVCVCVRACVRARARAHTHVPEGDPFGKLETILRILFHSFVLSFFLV